MDLVFQGVVHGKTIELNTSPGMIDGQVVEVVLRPSSHNSNVSGEHPDETSETIRSEPPKSSAAGLLANYPEMDNYLLEVMKLRKVESSRKV